MYKFDPQSTTNRENRDTKDSELFKDNLNITDFLNEQFNTLNGSAATTISPENDNGIGIMKMDSNNLSVNGIGPQLNGRSLTHGRGNPPNVNMPKMLQNPAMPVRQAQQQQQYRGQEQRVPSYDQNVLPESPPETDSGAGSSGSPSGSETSPFSPEYQQYHPGHSQNSVIQQPLPVVTTSHDPNAGVLLNVHGLDNLTQTIVNDYIMQNNVNTSHLNGQQMMTPEYYSSQPSSGSQQIAPDNYNAYLLPPPSIANNFAQDPLMSRKRMRLDSNQFIKPEPSSPPLGLISDDLLYGEDGMSHQSIRFFEFQKEQWHTLCDITGRELLPLGFHVVADKGFNFGHFDGAFVNQKKNHFQISAHIEVRDRLPPKFVKIPGENGVLRPIQEFQLDFYGVKTEMLSSSVQIKQSQTDRKPIPYEPIKLDLPPSRVTKVTVARLHFSETTMNNQRKNNRPNPDQKYFYLVVALNAIVSNSERYTVVAFNSEKVIVRASNPGQFDTGENEVHWQKGQTGNSIYHPGPVGIGTDKPNAALTVAGDVQYTGTLYHPSDGRLKQNIEEINCAEALSNLSQIRIVRYEIRPEIAEKWGMSDDERYKIGVIAQEVEQVVPDAVKENGEYLTVDDNRIFYESAAAVKELCRLTGNLEYKIEEVEKISKKFALLNKIKRFDSFRSSVSSNCSTNKVASVCASYLSCSRTSLNSPEKEKEKTKNNTTENSNANGGKSNEKTKRHRLSSDTTTYHHHHHHFCRSLGGDRGLCKNKVIQMTIVILVLVMAFCLIAMATLYVLDWHKRNNGNDNSNTPAATSADNRTSLSKSAGKGQNPGPAQMIYFTKPTALPHGNNGSAKSRKIIGGPAIHPCLKPPCQTFCCQNPSLLYTVDSNDNKTERKLPQQVYMITQISAPPPIGQNFARKHSGDKSKQIIQPEEALQFDYVVDDLVSDVIDGLVSDDGSTNRKKRHDNGSNTIGTKRNVTGKHFFQNTTGSMLSESNATVTIKIVGLNVSIDERYLILEDKRGNYTFYIPVSVHMPHIPLEVEFGIEDKQQVQFCTKNNAELCPGREHAYSSDGRNGSDVHKRQPNTWELPVGSYQHGLFRFRIGVTTTLCQLPDDEVGATFTEYSLLFYRVCQS